MFDGTLARATGPASQLGAFMDSVFDRAARASSTSASSSAAAPAASTDGPLLAAAAMGCRVHGQLRARQGRGPRLPAGTGMAAVGVMPARGPHRHPRRRPHRGRHPRRGADSVGCDALGVSVLLAALAIIARRALITVIQRILIVRHPAHRPPHHSTQSHQPSKENST